MNHFVQNVIRVLLLNIFFIFDDDDNVDRRTTAEAKRQNSTKSASVSLSSSQKQNTKMLPALSSDFIALSILITELLLLTE